MAAAVQVSTFPTILTDKGLWLCVTHCLCKNKLHSESTPGPPLAAGYFLSAMPAAKRSLDAENEINPLRMQQGGNGGAKRRRFPRVA